MNRPRPLLALLAVAVALATLGRLGPNPPTTAMPVQASGTVPTPRSHCGTPTPGLTPTSPAVFTNLVPRAMALGPKPCQACAGSGQSIGVIAELGNAGYAQSGPFVVEVNGARQAVGVLEAGKYVSLWFPGYRLGENEVIVDVLDEVYEPGQEDDNLLRAVLPTQTWPPPFPCTPVPPAERPDLTVSALAIGLPLYWRCGNDPALGLRVSLGNPGAADSGPFIVAANGTPRAYHGLPAGATAELWFAGTRPGEAQEAVVDTGDQVSEADETNNARREMLPVPTLPACPTVTPTVTPVSAEPDLVVAEAWWQMAGFNGACVPRHGPPELHATVRNLGGSRAGAFDISTDPPRYTWRISGGLLPATGVTVVGVIPQGADFVVADAANEVAESREDNNRRFAPNPTWTPPPICTAATPATPTVTPSATRRPGDTPTPTASRAATATASPTPGPLALPWLGQP